MSIAVCCCSVHFMDLMIVFKAVYLRGLGAQYPNSMLQLHEMKVKTHLS